MNIIAIIEGNEPQFESECVVIGAYSANRNVEPENLKSFINDNVSSVSTVIDIANIYTKNYIKPKRSIVFALYSQEEQLKFGTDLFVNYLPKSIEKIVAFFNIDCVEFSKRSEMDHGNGSAKVWYLSKKNNSDYTKMMLEPTASGYKCNSANTVKENVKNIFIINFTSLNSYEHLHLLSDTFDAHNIICFKKKSQLAFLFSLQLVNAYFLKDIMLQ